VEKYGTAVQATDDSIAHALCTLDNEGYKHTLRLCNTHCFSTATVVSRMRFVICTVSVLLCINVPSLSVHSRVRFEHNSQRTNVYSGHEV